MSGLCLDCMVGVAALRLEGWSQGKMYLTLPYMLPTPALPGGSLALYLSWLQGNDVYTAKLYPGDLDRDDVSPSIYQLPF